MEKIQKTIQVDQSLSQTKGVYCYRQRFKWRPERKCWSRKNFEFKDNHWQQLGGDIDGESEGDFSGISVDIKYSDKYIYSAIGAYKNVGSGDEAGHVRVYRNSSEITLSESKSGANEKELQQLYIAYLSRPYDPTGLDYWVQKRTSKEQFAASMYLQPEFKDLYGNYIILKQLIKYI